MENAHEDSSSDIHDALHKYSMSQNSDYDCGKWRNEPKHRRLNQQSLRYTQWKLPSSQMGFISLFKDSNMGRLLRRQSQPSRNELANMHSSTQ